MNNNNKTNTNNKDIKDTNIKSNNTKSKKIKVTNTLNGKKKTVGRKNNIEKDDKLITKLVKHITDGLSIRDACQLSGLASKTFYEYLIRADKDEENNVPNSPFVEFRDKIKNAEVTFKQSLISNIKKASTNTKTWQAAAWLLERKYKDEFGAVKNEFNIESDKVTIVSDMPKTETE